MKSKIILSALLAASVTGTVFADCNFTYVNKSSHPVTLQGIFLEDGDGMASSAWITVEPTRQVTQVRNGKKCNSIYQHTGQVSTRINLKNSSGYWIGNKGLIFAADRSYSHYVGDSAIADDGKPVTLSNGQKITRSDFKVFICDSKIAADDCK